MKAFIITSVVLLLIAILAAVGVFWYLSSNLSTNQSNAVATTTKHVTSTVTQDDTRESVEITPEQAQRLEAVGIDAADLTITQEQINCARLILSDERAAEIAAGDKPTLLEMGKLLTCL